MIDENSNYQPEIDSLAEDVANAVDAMRDMAIPCNECETISDVEQVLRNAQYRRNLTQLYSTLLEIDMRHNPERYFEVIEEDIEEEV